MLDHCRTVFHGQVLSGQHLADYLYFATDWPLSKKLVIGTELIGFYLLAEGAVAHVVAKCDAVTEALGRYEHKRGIEGIALVVLPEFRGRGYGELLKNVPRGMGYDYVFGQQLKSLNNLTAWLKRRRLIADCDGVWVTLEDLR